MKITINTKHQKCSAAYRKDKYGSFSYIHTEDEWRVVLIMYSSISKNISKSLHTEQYSYW